MTNSETGSAWFVYGGERTLEQDHPSCTLVRSLVESARRVFSHASLREEKHGGKRENSQWLQANVNSSFVVRQE